MDSLFTVDLPASFPHCKSALIPLLWEELHVAVHGFQTPNYNSLWIPNKPIFAKEISGSLFVLDQQKLRVWQQNLFGCGIAFSSMRKDKSHPGEGIPGVLWGRSNSDVRQTRKLRNWNINTISKILFLGLIMWSGMFWSPSQVTKKRN